MNTREAIIIGIDHLCINTLIKLYGNKEFIELYYWIDKRASIPELLTYCGFIGRIDKLEISCESDDIVTNIILKQKPIYKEKVAKYGLIYDMVDRGMNKLFLYNLQTKQMIIDADK